MLGSTDRGSDSSGLEGGLVAGLFFKNSLLVIEICSKV